MMALITSDAVLITIALVFGAGFLLGYLVGMAKAYVSVYLKVRR